MATTLDAARRKHQFDLYYVKHNSIWMDLMVLIETVTVVLFSGRGTMTPVWSGQTMIEPSKQEC